MFERLVQRTYDALARRDAATLMRQFAPDAVFELAGETAISGRYEGQEQIGAFFLRLFDRMEAIEATVDNVGFGNPLGFNFRNTMYVEWHVTERTRDSQTIHGDVLSVFRMRHGKCVLLREFWLDERPLAAVWGHRTAPDA